MSCKKYLVVFIIVQNLVVITAVALMVQKFQYFAFLLENGSAKMGFLKQRGPTIGQAVAEI